VTQKVPIQLEGGQVGTVDASELPQALEAGAQVVAPEVLARAELEAKYGGTGGEIAAAGAGAARGLTFGLSDLAAAGVSDELRTDLDALRTVNPNASMAGEVAGAVAPVLLSGGAGALRGLGAIPRGVNAIGGLAERGAAAIVGNAATSIAGRAAQRAVALGARGAAEGAFVGAGEQISEAALGNHEITAEKLMAGAASGALAGGALGGGLGALEGAGTAAIGKLRTRLDDIRARQAAKPTMATTAAGEVPATVVEKYAGQFENTEQLANAWKNRAKLFSRHDDTVEVAVRSVADDMTNAVKAERVVDMASFGEAKAAQMAKLVPETDMATRVTQRQTAMELGARARALLDELHAADGGGSKVAVNDLTRKLALFEKRVENATSGGEIFMHTDDLKRVFGQKARAGERDFGITEAERELRKFYHGDMIPALENEAVWGAGGVAQREVNEATAARLATRKAMANNFLAAGDKDGFVRLEVADPAKIEGFIKNLTSARNDLRQQSLTDYIARERKFLDAVDKHYTLSATEKKAIAEARASFTAIESNLTKTAQSVSEVNAAKRLLEEERAFAMGGITGAVTDVFMRPMTTLARLADIERAVQRVDQKISHGVGVFFKKPQVAVPMTGKAEPIRASFQKRVTELSEASASPERVAEKMTKRIGDLGEHAPNVSAAASALEAKKTAFLASKIPPGTRTLDGLQPHLSKPRVSDLEMARFMRYARAADEPLSIVEDLKHGKVSREAVEAVRELYPNVYETVQKQVTEQLANAKERVPYSKQVQLGIVLDIKTHPSLEPSFIRAMQEQWSAKDDRKMPTRPMPAGKIVVATAAERMEGR
jgi:hypothetical protein